MAAQRRVNPNQLRMFMTPKEIRAHYAPLAGDIGEVEENVTAMGGTYRPETHAEVWQRKSEEAQLSPREYHEARSGESFRTPQFDIEGVMERSSYPQPPSTETTSAWGEYEFREGQYLERKAEEHQEAWDRQMGRQSLWGYVRQHGVESPVHLGVQFGESGKPEVVGGHHRIASAYDTRPNQLMPVLHHETLAHAKPMEPLQRQYVEQHRRTIKGAEEALRQDAFARMVNRAGYGYT